MGSAWKCLGSILATYVFYPFFFFLWNCVRVNKAMTMGAVEQRLWQRDTDWDVVVAERPNWLLALPVVAPGLSLTDTLGHFLCVSVRTDICTLPGECLQPHADSY